LGGNRRLEKSGKTLEKRKNTTVNYGRGLRGLNKGKKKISKMLRKPELRPVSARNRLVDFRSGKTSSPIWSKKPGETTGNFPTGNERTAVP